MTADGAPTGAVRVGRAVPRLFEALHDAYPVVMTDQNPDPDPRRTPGLEPGGQVPPGETPPAEGSTSEAGPEETHNPTTGWSRTPMIVLGVVVAVFVVYFVVWAILL